MVVISLHSSPLEPNGWQPAVLALSSGMQQRAPACQIALMHSLPWQQIGFRILKKLMCLWPFSG